jgi:hemolysin III
VSIRESAEALTVADRRVLYDTRRGVYYPKPVLRGWLHLLWFAASLVGGTLLVRSAQGAARVTSVAVYAGSVSGLFGISALYHRGNWHLRWARRLQRLDHMMIFLLIAGTATPAFLVAAPGRYGLVCLIVLWAVTVAAAVTHLVWVSAPERYRQIGPKTPCQLGKAAGRRSAAAGVGGGAWLSSSRGQGVCASTGSRLTL